MLKKSLIILISFSLQSCQQSMFQTTVKQDKTNNNFKTKTIDSDDLSVEYFGLWKYNSVSQEPLWQQENTALFNVGFGDVPGAFVGASYLDLNNLITGQNWEQSVNLTPRKYETDGNIIQTQSSNSTSITCSGNFNYDSYGYRTSNGNGETIPDYTINYNGSGWVTKGNYKYNFNKNKDTSITFDFIGTNIEIYGMKGRDAGWNNLKITIRDSNGNIETVTGFDDNNNPVNMSNISTFSNQNALGKIVKIKALKSGFHNVKIESADTSRSQGKVSFLYGFQKAIVYPSIQYNFAEHNIAYKAFKNSNGGIVDIIVKDDTNNIIDNQEKDLYSMSPNSFNDVKVVYSKSFNNSFYKTITIEATGKSSIPNNKDITIQSFGKFSSISGNFKGNKLITQFYRTSQASNLSLYIDDIYHSNINLQDTSDDSRFNSKIDVGGNETANHSFKIVSDYSMNNNPISATLLGYSGMQKVRFNFKSHYSGNLHLNSRKGNNKGKMKISIKNLDSGVEIPSELRDLYSSTPSNFDEVFPLSAGSYSLTLEPDYTRNQLSGDFMIDFDNISFFSNSNFDGLTNGGNSIDTICTP